MEDHIYILDTFFLACRPVVTSRDVYTSYFDVTHERNSNEIIFYLHSNAESCITLSIYNFLLWPGLPKLRLPADIRAKSFAANRFARESLTTNKHINNKR